MRLSCRARAALAAGKVVSFASRLAGRGRGQVVGGKVMLAIDPGLLASLGRCRRVALVSATNGKSTTTRFLAEALRAAGPVAHNATGANMATGIVTALAANRRAPYAALEVDEAHLPAIAQAVRPDVIVLMNLSRDQLDRGAEVTLLAQRWRGMLESATWPLTVVANADDPLVAWAAQPAERPGSSTKTMWVAPRTPWRQDSMLCPSCGDELGHEEEAWACGGCGLTRPTPRWRVEGGEIITDRDARITPDLRVPGQFNVGNAAMALAAASLLGLDPERAAPALTAVADVDGRYLLTDVEGRDVRLLLGKNPASWAELLDIVGSRERELVIAINARGADGRDPSWLWDVPFERLAGGKVIVSGERRFDVAVRMDVAGVEVADVVADGLDAIRRHPRGTKVDLVANYTALLATWAKMEVG